MVSIMPASTRARQNARTAATGRPRCRTPHLGLDGRDTGRTSASISASAASRPARVGGADLGRDGEARGTGRCRGGDISARFAPLPPSRFFIAAAVGALTAEDRRISGTRSWRCRPPLQERPMFGQYARPRQGGPIGSGCRRGVRGWRSAGIYLARDSASHERPATDRTSAPTPTPPTRFAAHPRRPARARQVRVQTFSTASAATAW